MAVHSIEFEHKAESIEEFAKILMYLQGKRVGGTQIDKTLTFLRLLLDFSCRTGKETLYFRNFRVWSFFVRVLGIERKELNIHLTKLKEWNFLLKQKQGVYMINKNIFDCNCKEYKISVYFRLPVYVQDAETKI